MNEPVVEAVRAGFARSDRVFWLDGGGSRDWSGRRSLVGVLDQDDVSLSFDAARREVTRHQGGRDEVVGTRRLRGARGRDRPRRRVTRTCTGWAASATRPGPTSRRVPGATARTRSGCGRGTSSSSTTRAWKVRGFETLAGARSSTSGSAARSSTTGGDARLVRRGLRPRPGAAPRRELLRGEPDLPRRGRRGRPTRSATYLRLRATNPAPYAGLLRHRGTHLLSSSPERYATIDRQRWLETKPMKGTVPRGSDRARGRDASRPTWRGTRGSVRRT